jgi:hypothetical protein
VPTVLFERPSVPNDCLVSVAQLLVEHLSGPMQERDGPIPFDGQTDLVLERIQKLAWALCSGG